jgi:quercetin dioxygenase-like cupin family protein
MRPGIRGQFLASKALGATGVSLLTNTVAPGAAAPLHKHTVEETMLVLEGTVWVQVDAARYTVGPHHTVIIPPHTPHAWGNAGPGEAKLLWAFAGPDPFADATYLEGTPPKV